MVFTVCAIHGGAGADDPRGSGRTAADDFGGGVFDECVGQGNGGAGGCFDQQEVLADVLREVWHDDLESGVVERIDGGG